MSEYTDAQIIAAIGSAMKAKDYPAVVGMIKILALQNPREAELVTDLLVRLGKAVDS